jgi:peptidyl-prolyl cis-trans isomerase SurA
MFTQGQNEITSVKDFFEYVKKKQVANEKSSVNVQVSKLYNDFVETKVLAYEDNQLEKKYPDFKYLMQEYRDGILLFQIMEDEVWQKSIKDTLGLRTFYANNKDKFQMPERINGLLLSTTSKEKLTEAQKLLGQMPYTMGKRLNDILYDKNQSSITSEIKERLFDVIVIMKKNPEYLVEIAGNIDPTEADSISGARAKKVVKYLTDNGILLARITEKDNGKFEPVSRTDRKLNQRLSFNFFSTSKKDIEKLLNKDNPEAVSLIDGYFKKGDSKIVDGADWKVGNQAFEKNGRFYYLDIRRVEAPRPKRFDEARGVVINAYQQYLEKQLLENLRKEYQININEEELKKLK